jgi:hypothetical protein
MNPKLIFSVIAGAVALILFGGVLVTACSAATPPTPNPTAIDGALNAWVELQAQGQYIQLTQQVIDNERILLGTKMTATQQVIDATATQAQHRENIQATQQANSATQQAFQVTVAAAQAADTATAQARAVEQTSTAQAQATATQWAVIGTTSTAEAKGTQQSAQATLDAPAVAARNESLRIQTEKAKLELENAKSNAWWGTWGWVLAAIAIFLALGWYFFKKSQIGVITDGDGKVRLIMIKDRALQPGLMFNPVLDFTGKTGASVPSLGVPDELQRQVVHERSIVDAIHELPQGYPRQALGMAAGLSTPQNPAVNIQVVQPGQVQGWLDDVQGQIAQHEEDA